MSKNTITAKRVSDHMARYVPVPLAFICVQPDTKAEDKPPIIFLHGLTSSKEYWNTIPQAAANATRRKVFVIDSRNHGDSDWSDVAYADCNVDDLLNFMDYIRAPKAILVGHSMGGRTGINTALKAPKRVEKLVVEDTIVKILPQEILNTALTYVSLMNAAILEVPLGTDEWTAKEIILKYIHDKIPGEKPKVIRQNPADIQLKPTPEGGYRYKANVSVLERTMRIGRSTISECSGVYLGPTIFIYGALSPFRVGEEEQNIKQYFPNSEFIIVGKASHNVHLDCPKEFMDSLLTFLLTEQHNNINDGQITAKY